jgi:hypothetical protein
MRDLSEPGTVEALLTCLAQHGKYVGFRLGDQVHVKADGREVFPQRSLSVRNHSPDGFNWGYGGSGPAQLALALLLEAGLPDDVAVTLYQDFKWQVVGQWNTNLNWLLRGEDLRYWIEQQLWREREKQFQSA